jgi:hypothetical protein
MELPPQLTRILHEALVDAFDEPRLVLMIATNLDSRADRVAPGRGIDERALALVQWAASQDRLVDLVKAALEQAAGNAQLQRAEQEVAAFLAAAPPPASHASEPAPGAAEPKYEMFRIIVEGDETRRFNNGPPERVRVDPLALDAARVFNRWYAAGQLNREDDLRVFGAHLFKILLGAAPGDSFDAASDLALARLIDKCKNARHDEALYVRLALQFKDPKSDLASFPWEYLYVPAEILQYAKDTRWPPDGFFLTNEERVALTRTPPETTELSPAQPPLRVLIVDLTSRPQAADRPKWMVELEDESGARGASKLIQFRTVSPRSLGDLRDWHDAATQEQDGPFHVVHFIGRGRVEKERGRILIGEEAVSPFGIGEDVGLLVLHAPAESRDESYAAFCRAVIDPGADKRRFGAFIAAQVSVTATRFLKEFYRSLYKGWPIDVAIQKARRMLPSDCGEFGSPIIYLQRWGAIMGTARAVVQQPREQESALVRGGRYAPQAPPSFRPAGPTPAGAPDTRALEQADMQLKKFTGGVKPMQPSGSGR